MGQYGNQPDFGTRSQNVTPTGNGNPASGSVDLKSAALYIGTGGTLLATVIGDPTGAVRSFKNIPNGTFFPVIVKYVWDELPALEESTTCSDIIALY
jgi:hypothetical protein